MLIFLPTILLVYFFLVDRQAEFLNIATQDPVQLYASWIVITTQDKRKKKESLKQMTCQERKID